MVLLEKMRVRGQKSDTDEPRAAFEVFRKRAVLLRMS